MRIAMTQSASIGITAGLWAAAEGMSSRALIGNLTTAQIAVQRPRTRVAKQVVHFMALTMSGDYRLRTVQRVGICLHGLCLGALLALLLLPASMQASGQETQPTRHFTVPNPAELTDADAEMIYKRLSERLVRGYQLSNHPVARSYMRWRRFNRMPYRSAPHGERFVNHYANSVAHDAYGALQGSETMPVGSVIAKDSFAVTEAGEVYSGPLFLMEKRPEGFNPAGRDWRYTLIMPDGSVFGDTHGPDSQKVEFCQTCHATAGDENDHLFFVPQLYRFDSSAE